MGFRGGVVWPQGSRVCRGCDLGFRVWGSGLGDQVWGVQHLRSCFGGGGGGMQRLASEVPLRLDL